MQTSRTMLVGTGFTTRDAAVTEVHAGYEFQAGEDVAIYVQGGPAFVSIDGEETETEISGKVGWLLTLRWSHLWRS